MVYLLADWCLELYLSHPNCQFSCKGCKGCNELQEPEKKFDNISNNDGVLPDIRLIFSEHVDFIAGEE